MLRLRTLGSFGVVDASGSAASLPPHRFALLVLVAVSGDRGIARDRLLGYLWPESTPAKARAALEQMLHALRVTFGDRSILLGNPLQLDPRTLSSDVMDFQAAFNARDFERAVSLYQGPFLDGFYLSGVPEFDTWVESERHMLADRYRVALEHLADSAVARGDLASAIEQLRALGASSPYDGRIAYRLMEAHIARGERDAALQVAAQYAARVHKDLQAEPEPLVSELADQLRISPLAGAHRSETLHQLTVEHGSLMKAAAVTNDRAANVRQHHKQPTRTTMTVALALAGIALVGVTVQWMARRTSTERNGALAAFVVPLADGQLLASMLGQAVAISPDGSQYVFAAGSANETRLYLRPIDHTRAVPIAGTERAATPFFSPDGQSIGFVVDDRRLVTLHISTGQTRELAQLEGGFRGASWGPGDTIIYADRPGRIFRVAVHGGEPRLVAQPRPGEDAYWWPSQLPGGAILFAITSGGTFDRTRIVALKPESGEYRTLLDYGNHPKYLPSGHLLFASVATGRRGIIDVQAVPFDVVRLEVLGPPVSVLDSVAFSAGGRRVAQYDVARNGSLIYVRPKGTMPDDSLMWVDRSERSRAIDFAPRRPQLHVPSLSPDGESIGLTATGDSMQTWILDLKRKTASLFPRGTRRSHFTIWSPNGKRVVTASDLDGGALNLYLAHVEDDSRAERLTNGPQHQDPSSWSPDERYLVYASDAGGRNWDIWVLDFAARPAAARPLIRTTAQEYSGMVAPNGRWLAYVSHESGQAEVYVERFPQLGGRRQVSRNGGRNPLWSAAGDELFYTSPDSAAGPAALWSVRVRHDPGLLLSEPRLVLRNGPSGFGYGRPNYDITKDGQHFLIVRHPAPLPSANEFVTVLNWASDLKRRVPYPN